MPEQPSARKRRPAAGARIMVGGISIAAGLGLVGTMAITAATPSMPPSPQIVRVVVVPSNGTTTATLVSPDSANRSEPAQVSVPPAAAPPPVELTPPPTPPTTISQGS